ncbi:MAG: polysaccharide deacetylase family protein [Flavobacteriaceae bacterium]
MGRLLKTLIRLSNRPMLVPFYHMVSDDENTFADYLYTPRKIKTFKEDLKVLLKHYRVVSLEDFIKLSRQKGKHKKPFVHLTFDDGLANFYDVVAPILHKEKIPATVFVNTDFIDNKRLFYRYKASLLIQFYQRATDDEKQVFHRFLNTKSNVKEKLLAINFHQEKELDQLAENAGYSFSSFLEKEQPYLTSHQIKELINKGFTIGAHSKNHPLFSNLTLDEQVVQAKESIAWLQENFQVDYKAFSFPFTDLGVTKDFFFKMESEFDVSFGTSGIKKDVQPTNYQRISFELAQTNLGLFLLKQYTKYFFKIPFNKHIMPRV